MFFANPLVYTTGLIVALVVTIDIVGNLFYHAS